MKLLQVETVGGILYINPTMINTISTWGDDVDKFTIISLPVGSVDDVITPIEEIIAALTAE